MIGQTFMGCPASAGEMSFRLRGSSTTRGLQRPTYQIHRPAAGMADKNERKCLGYAFPDIPLS